jgi:phospholipase D1/2
MRDRNFWCDEKVDGAGVLVDADAYFRSFYRAAETAEHSILLSGWQFDSEVALLRGDDANVAARDASAGDAALPVTLKAFLNTLCERRPELRIFVLAWDFHVAFALEREWIQELVFNWTTSERFRFLFDSSHVDKGCHHQKFAVIDGQLSFLGGLDLCDHRWDDRQHLDENPLRTSRGGEPHKPFHDVQVWLEGRDVAQRLTELFVCRWQLASGSDEKIVIATPPKAKATTIVRPTEGIEIPTAHVALSRTDPQGSPNRSNDGVCIKTSGESNGWCREVEHFYIDAIEAAERSIYVETQYFSSLVVSTALVDRILATDARALEIVLILNMRAETLKEEVAVGLAQAKVLLDLRAAAAKNTTTPHRLGIYYTVPASSGHDGTAEEPKRSTYIHSKVMIVDDRILNIGSANLTNRSGSVDTELNATFEALTTDEPLAKMITRLRCDLLGEHLGDSPSVVAGMKSLVEELDGRARRREGRLRLHPSPTENETKVLDVIDPQGLPFDPHGVEEDAESRSLFVHGLGALFRRLFSDRDDTK